jgi:hypothetical protein
MTNGSFLGAADSKPGGRNLREMTERDKRRVGQTPVKGGQKIRRVAVKSSEVSQVLD